jgi:hypothetical protein
MRQSIVTAVILCSLATLRGADRRAMILERSAKLSGFLGETIPQPGWASYLADDTLAHSPQELMQQAEEIAKGTVFFYDRTPIYVGLKNID